MDKQPVNFQYLGEAEYKWAWDYQERLLQQTVQRKAALAKGVLQPAAQADEADDPADKKGPAHYFLLCEHPPVYTLGKSGHLENILISETEMEERGIGFYRTNRGGDITFHGPGQVVGYPILDLEQFYTDIGKYLRNLEEMILLTLAEYGIAGKRSQGETGVWIQPDVPGRERKICAIGVRCSRWVTMHGFALNVNTDLGYFDQIIPCGIQNKKVTSLEKELGRTVDMKEVRKKIQQNFEKVFNTSLVEDAAMAD